MTKLSNTHILVLVSVVFIAVFYTYSVFKTPLGPSLSITSSSTPSTISNSATSGPVAVTPIPNSDLDKQEEPKPEPKPVAAKACFVGGCSSQICSTEEGVVSTCEWRSAYACYQKTTCEVQPSGECGWTPNAELNSCLVESENSAF